jgi:hypothetical protein
MDQASKDVAKLFGVASPPEPSRDGLGTTHHETGGMYMGAEASDSVTLPDSRIRHLKNAYVVGPAVFPTIGSPNPMLTGVALARRLGDQLSKPTAWTGDPGFQVLFNGFDIGLWRMTTIRNQPPNRSNPGSMRVLNGALETVAGNDVGIFWHTVPTPPNFVLKLQWLRWHDAANSGVYVRFPNPDSKNYNNTAFVADDFGFEVQIDEFGDMPVHRTGAIYRKDDRTDFEILNQIPARAPGEWNDYEIRVENQLYTVFLNGQQVCLFDNSTAYPTRGHDAETHVGLQIYPDPKSIVAYRDLQIRTLP